MLLARRGDEAFEESEATELRAVAYRIALAIENGLLHKRHDRPARTAAPPAGADRGAGRHARARRCRPARGRHARLRGGRLGERRAGRPSTASSSCCRVPERPASSASRPTASAAAGSTRAGRASRSRSPARRVGRRRRHRGAGGRLRAAPVARCTSSASARSRSTRRCSTSRAASRRATTRSPGCSATASSTRCSRRRSPPARRSASLLFDIDDFKQINDLHGHQTGDHALRLVSDALRQATRAGDSVFRIGGEEFCALLPGLAEQDAWRWRKRCARGSPRSSRRCRTRSPSASASPASRRTGTRATSCWPLRRRRALRLQARRQEPHDASRAASPVAGPCPSRREVGLDLLHQKDPDTVSHSVHVAILAVEIARALGVDDARLDDLRIAARLHDIGKIGGARRDPQQARTARRRGVPHHQDPPARRRRAARAAGASPAPARSSAQHHERIDGSGYPPDCAATRSASRAASCTPRTRTSR